MVLKSQTAQHGFFVVKRFESLYREFAQETRFKIPTYAFPLFGTDPGRLSVRYHGLDRDAVCGKKKRNATLAEIRFDELERVGAVVDEVIQSQEHADEILEWAEKERPGDYEIIWGRIRASAAVPPTGFRSIGWEPTYFGGDHFSAVCDCMCFPRWHGTDPDGTQLREYFARLNANGLFPAASTAAD